MRGAGRGRASGRSVQLSSLAGPADSLRGHVAPILVTSAWSQCDSPALTVLKLPPVQTSQPTEGLYSARFLTCLAAEDPRQGADVFKGGSRAGRAVGRGWSVCAVCLTGKALWGDLMSVQLESIQFGAVFQHRRPFVEVPCHFAIERTVWPVWFFPGRSCSSSSFHQALHCGIVGKAFDTGIPHGCPFKSFLL